MDLPPPPAHSHSHATPAAPPAAPSVEGDFKLDPERSASAVRSYINSALYPKLLAAMTELNRARPAEPLKFVGRTLLEGKPPSDMPGNPDAALDPSAPAYAYFRETVALAMHEAVSNCIKQNPRPSDPCAFVGKQLLAK